MLANHPITGQQIKVMRTSAKIHADNKTLIWVRSTFQQSERWNRYFTAISEPDAIQLLDAKQLTLIILTKESDINSWKTIIQNREPGVFVCAPVSQIIKLENLGVRLTNDVFVIEDLYDSYPYLGSALIESDDVPTILIAMAHILRIRKIIWSNTPIVGRLNPLYYAWKNLLHGEIVEVDTNTSDDFIPRTWLIQQFFRHPSARRCKEIRSCLEKNLENKYIDNILLLNEEVYPEIPTTNSKLRCIDYPHRLTYYDILKTAIDKIPKKDYVLFANSDVYVDNTLINLWRIQLDERRMFIALLRWEEDGKIFGPRSDSQDLWIVSRNNLDFELSREDFDFPLGKPGCDNAITYEMMKRKFLIVNPAYTIKIHHLHSSNIRNYDIRDILYKPVFVYVEPCAVTSYVTINNVDFSSSVPKKLLHDLKQYKTTSFSRVIHSVNEQHTSTCISMLKYLGIDGYANNSENLYTPTSLFPTLYHIEGGLFAEVSGLIYNFSQVILGNQVWVDKWNSTELNIFKPSMYVQKLLIYPIEEEYTNSLSKWILYYLPRVTFLRRALAKHKINVEFLIPRTNYIGDFLNDCVWDTQKINIVTMITDMNYYSTDVWAVPPNNCLSAPVTKEDIDTLRSLLPIEQSKNELPTVTICCDENSIFTREFAESLQSIVLQNWNIYIVDIHSSPIEIRKYYQASSWLIGCGETLNYMWMAKEGCKILEFQNMNKPCDKIIHLTGACGHFYILGNINHLEPIHISQQNAIITISQSIQKFGFSENLKVIRKNKSIQKPLLILPINDKSSIFALNTGLREMIYLWKERNYCDIIETNDTQYIWWEGIGKILLYDYPTLRYWNENITFQFALFANCEPNSNHTKTSVWYYWGKSPRALEHISSTNSNLRSWENRPIESVFMGRIENGVQETIRNKYDWNKSVELFCMPVDTTGTTYPFTHEEYLEKLCSSKFGLCLGGVGPKTHREIECMACGCVPIVTDEISMKSYITPPIEGIHYLRAKTPDDVKKQIHACTPEQWSRMSVACRNWWRTYASVEGLFRATWEHLENFAKLMRLDS